MNDAFRRTGGYNRGLNVTGKALIILRSTFFCFQIAVPTLAALAVALPAVAVIALSTSTAAYGAKTARQRPSYEALYKWEQGIQLTCREEDEAALPYMEAAVKLYPDEPLFLCGRAHVKINLNDTAGALSDLNKAIAIDSTMGGAYGRRALCYCMMGQFSRAITDLNKAISLGQIDYLRWNDHVNYANRAKAFRAIGKISEAGKDEQMTQNLFRVQRARDVRELLQLKQAISMLDEVVKLCPQSAEPVFVRGICNLNENRNADAVRDFSTVIQKQPAFIAAYYFRADAYFRMRKDDSALKDYTRIINANPVYVAATDTAETGRNKGHRQFYDESLVTVADVHVLRSMIFSNQGKYDAAYDDLAKAIALDPKDSDARLVRAELARRRRKFEQTVEDCTHVIRHAPTNYRAYDLRSKAYEMMRQPDRAIEDLSKMIVQSRGGPEGYLLRAQLYSRLEKWDKAIADYGAVSKTLPQDEAILVLRGNCYMKVGKFQSAIDDYTSAIALDARAMVYSLRAAAYEKLGKSDLAKQDRESATRRAEK